MKKIETTRSQIFKHLKKGGKLSSLLAFNLYGTLSLQQHINILRNRGADIKTEMKQNKVTGVRFAEYTLKK